MTTSQQSQGRGQKIPADPIAVRRKRLQAVLAKLKPLYERDPIEVHYDTPFQLVVGVILSAQCTDKRVNEVTSQFFEYLRQPQDFLALPPGELERLIKPTGFFRNKAKSILGAAQQILNEHDGRIPATLTELVRLPGFGRKTANVVLNELYGRQEGIAVDTHVLRLTKRLKLTSATNPEKVERDLMQLTTRTDWGVVAHLLILHGRRVCFARSPNCPGCVLRHLCMQWQQSAME